MKVLTDNYDTVLNTISGIEFNGKKYDVDDILLTVLENIENWNVGSSTDEYTEVERI
jgi:hypothetical protein